jgi:hypothetical protein
VLEASLPGFYHTMPTWASSSTASTAALSVSSCFCRRCSTTCVRKRGAKATGLMVAARSFTGKPYDGHALAEQLKQATILTEDTGNKPRRVVVDQGFRGVDAPTRVFRSSTGGV